MEAKKIHDRVVELYDIRPVPKPDPRSEPKPDSTSALNKGKSGVSRKPKSADFKSERSIKKKPSKKVEREYAENQMLTNVSLPSIIEFGFDPSEPTFAEPGSSDKVEMLAARRAAGLPLWHPEDANSYMGYPSELHGFDILYDRALIEIASSENEVPTKSELEEDRKELFDIAG